jgi:hypothetical protein
LEKFSLRKDFLNLIWFKIAFMAWHISLKKSLRILEEFRNNPCIQIPLKSPCTNLQSLGKFKNPIFIPNGFFSAFGPISPEASRPTRPFGPPGPAGLLLAPPAKQSRHYHHRYQPQAATMAASGHHCGRKKSPHYLLVISPVKWCPLPSPIL